MSNQNRPASIYDITVTTIDGVAQSLADFRGTTLLVVNVASRCGYTPQYAALETLHRQYADRGFAVLGFPCNQFGNQEPGSEDEIKQFCSAKFGVTFPMFAKVDVNGAGAHPLFVWLKQEAPGFLGTAIRWNFAKFLVGPRGDVVRRYASTTSPTSIASDIEALLDAVPSAATR